MTKKLAGEYYLPRTWKELFKIPPEGCFDDKISHIVSSYYVIYASLDLIRKYFPISQCSQMVPEALRTKAALLSH